MTYALRLRSIRFQFHAGYAERQLNLTFFMVTAFWEIGDSLFCSNKVISSLDYKMLLC